MKLTELVEDGFKYIARDHNGDLYAFLEKPEKRLKVWISFDIHRLINKPELDFIKWEDEEPYNIAELIEEYENSPEYVTYISNERTRILSNDLWSKLEREETEVKKDLEWAIKEIEGLETETSQNYPHDEMVEKEIVLGILSQLDEPEVLSQEWITENSVEGGFRGVQEFWYGEFIEKEKVENLLVPKQELPMIPKFVADWVESRDYYNVYKVLQDLSAPGSPHASKDVRNWIFRNQENVEKFVRAWLDGYEVEEEQKYIISINITDKDSKTNYETFLNKRGIFHSMENDSFNSEEFNWSEEEIRGLTKGDILFEHFAVKVEELEE